MVSEEKFLTAVSDRTQTMVTMEDDLVEVTLDSLDLIDTLQYLEEQYKVALPVRRKLPLSYLYSLCSKSQ